jgi:hypothetical protein
MKITIEIGDETSSPLKKATQWELEMILLDALAEFVSHRMPAREYVENRYPDFTADWKGDKVIQTNRRIVLAEAMHEFHQLTIDR